MIAGLLALLLLVAGVPSEADMAASAGAYDQADRLYAAEKGDPVVLAMKRLAVAQARHDMPRARQLIAELEPMLAKNPDPEVEMRLALTQGMLAYRSYRLKEAAQAFARARRIAEKLTSPGAQQALYECQSYEYMAGLDRTGRPDLVAYTEAAMKAWPAGPPDPAWPLDPIRRSFWDRMWVYRGWEYMYALGVRGQQEEAIKWATAAGLLGMSGLQAYMRMPELNTNPGLALAAMHLAAEVTEDFPLSAIAEDLLKALADVEKLPPTLEARHLSARYHKARARWLFFARKQPAEALKEYLLAAEGMKAAQRPVDLVDIWLEPGYLICLHEAPADWIPTAQKLIAEALPLSRQLEYSGGLYSALGLSGVMAARRNDPAAAEPLLRQSAAELERWILESGAGPRGKSELLARPEFQLFAETWLKVLQQLDRTQEAMETALRLETQSHLADVDLQRVKGRTPEVTRALETVERARQEGEVLRGELQAAQAQGNAVAAGELQRKLADNVAELNQAVNTLRREDPDFERLVAVRPASLARLQAYLPEDTLLVEYYPGQSQLYLFTATRSGLKMYSVQVGRNELEGKITALRRSIAQREQPVEQLQQLYRWLIQPIEPELAGKRVLGVIPSGGLYYLPFAALATPAPLADRLAITVLTATDLVDLGRGPAPPRPSRLLALANPDGSLPFAQREVEQMAALFPEPEVLIGPRATKAPLQQAGRSGVVHLATHGTLDSQDPNESYVLLSGQDNRLTTGEIYSLQFHDVSLVTLSACQTALGERKPGAEVAHLAQAFSVAGSKTTLASLWKVEDEATSRLMVEFYRRLLAGDSKAEALRKAQLEVRKEARWASPFFWASFQLMGDWR